MAFVNSFTLNASRTRAARSACAARATSVRASASNHDDDGAELPPLGARFNHAFQRFDGSTPLLPPWRPPSLEHEFGYRASRIESRESANAPFRRIVKVEKDGVGTMFAEVVQHIGRGRDRLWLRPLLLSSDGKDTAVDLRGATDVVLDSERVREVDSETRLRVSVNLIATEEDVVSRAVSDERWAQVGTDALLAFMKRLCDGNERK